MIPVIDDGMAEIQSAKDLERDTESMRNGYSEASVLEKFIFIMLYPFQKDIARQALKGEILVAHVAYENGYVSKLFFEKL